jgi:hypothetical protein
MKPKDGTINDHSVFSEMYQAISEFERKVGRGMLALSSQFDAGTGGLDRRSTALSIQDL